MNLIAYPVSSPVIGDVKDKDSIFGATYDDKPFTISLTGNRMLKNIDIVCADSTSIYARIDDHMTLITISPFSTYQDVLLCIPKSQILSTDPKFPASEFIFRRYADRKISNESFRIVALKPTTKYIVRSFIFDKDSAGGITINIGISNLSQNRLKYANFAVKYYNNVDDQILNQIGNYKYMNCKLTGYVEPGTGKEGNWNGFYNYTTKYIKVSSVTLTYSSGNTTTIQRGNNALLIIDN